MATYSITTITQVREYAMKNYNNGGDMVVEGYDDFQIQDILDECKSNKKSVRNYLRDMFETYESSRKDVEGTIDVVPTPVVEPVTPPEPIAPKTTSVEVEPTNVELTDANGKPIKFTDKQKLFISLMPKDDFYENGLDSMLWTDVFMMTISNHMNGMAGGAMISTLREKGIISVGRGSRDGKKDAFFGFTAKGKLAVVHFGLLKA